MNLYFALPALALFSFSVSATAELETEKQQLSYVMGTSFAINVAQQELDLDIPAFLQAIEDVLTDTEPRLSVEKMETVLAQYKDTVDKKLSDEIMSNQNTGQEFLAQNKNKEGIIESPSGLQYKIITAGTGKQPQPDSEVTVHYKGTLIDGQVFDSSYDRGEPITLSLSQVIKGWQEAIPMMKTGAKWQIYVPSELAYGDRGAGQLIGPGSVLIFDIELISTTP